MKCERCNGCGRLADSKDREPWTVWTSMPLASSAAVLMGFVKPVLCMKCEGTGERQPLKPPTPCELLERYEKALRTLAHFGDFTSVPHSRVRQIAAEALGFPDAIAEGEDHDRQSQL